MYFFLVLRMAEDQTPGNKYPVKLKYICYICAMIKNNVKNILKAQGCTQKELARKLGVSAHLLQYYLTGNITLSNLSKIAGALGVPAWELLKNPGEQNAPNPGEPSTTKPREANPETKTICPHCGKAVKLTLSKFD